MRRLTREELVAGLRAAGVARGGLVHVQSDLRTIGPVDAPLEREAILAFYLDGFQEALGPEGTLTCCTAFEDYARYGKPFDRATSPSLTDTFSEYVRTRPGAVRSFHPIVSVTGLGPRAAEICGGNHYEGFGYDSPWGRLHRAGALIMTLGLGPLEGGSTFFHYVETIYPVPYKYTKAYPVPVLDGGRPVPGLFTLNVRYLDFAIANTPIRIKPHLVALGHAKVVRIGRAETWSCPAGPAFAACLERLGQDRYFLLEAPPRFRPGEIPTDGFTGDLKHALDRGTPV